ncbi:Hypothetical predicted protein [Octopus vulgaris]|uniref:Uncharacterized protein n=2 Tax=Octopus vulgaris TaxID=6645 RepID=A0AA36EW28_OCTVU|nr:Hypothetical predicted protein [Octopus vulgaris]
MAGSSMFSCKVKKYFSYSLTDAIANSPKSSQMVRKMSSRVEDEEDIIDVDVSDDEKYNANNVFQGLWIPYPDQVAEMFEKLDNGGLPVLKWKCPGRRPPEVEKEDEDMDIEQKLVVEQKIEELKEEKKVPQPTEFDFDDGSLEQSTTKLTPRKTPGSSKGKKRVARMDKVLDDLNRQRKATEATKDQRKKGTPKSARGSAGGRFFSSPRTPMSAEKYAPSITPPGTPRSVGAKSSHNRLLSSKYTPPLRSTSSSPRTLSSPKSQTGQSAEKNAAQTTSTVTKVPQSTLPSDAEFNATEVTQAESVESPIKTSGSSTGLSIAMTTAVVSSSKYTPLTQALMTEPMAATPQTGSSGPILTRKSSLSGSEVDLSSQAIMELNANQLRSVAVSGQSSSGATATATSLSQGGTLLTPQSRTLSQNILQTSGETSVAQQERFTLSSMVQGANNLTSSKQVPHQNASEANEPSPSATRERLSLSSMVRSFDLSSLTQQEKQTLSSLIQSRELSSLQNQERFSQHSEGDIVSLAQQYSSVPKVQSSVPVGFSQSHAGSIGDPAVTQSYMMPKSAIIGKPPPPYSVAIAEKAQMILTSIAGRKDANAISHLSSGVADKSNVAFVKGTEMSLPSSISYNSGVNWNTLQTVSTDSGTNIVSSTHTITTPQSGVNSLATNQISQLLLQKTPMQTVQQFDAQRKDDKQTLDLVNTSLSAVRAAISQSTSKESPLVHKKVLGFSSVKNSSNAVSTPQQSDVVNTVATNNSLLQHMLVSSATEAATSASILPSLPTQELNLHKLSLSSVSLPSSTALTQSTSHSSTAASHISAAAVSTSTATTTAPTRPRLNTIAALLNIDSGQRTQAELRKLSLAGISADGSTGISNFGQSLGIGSASNYSSVVTTAGKAITSLKPLTIVTSSNTVVAGHAVKPRPKIDANQSVAFSENTFQSDQQQQQSSNASVSES